LLDNINAVNGGLVVVVVVLVVLVLVVVVLVVVVVGIDDKHSKQLTYEYQIVASAVVGAITDSSTLHILVLSLTVTPSAKGSND
jgi:hypothetical protein